MIYSQLHKSTPWVSISIYSLLYPPSDDFIIIIFYLLKLKKKKLNTLGNSSGYGPHQWMNSGKDFTQQKMCMHLFIWHLLSTFAGQKLTQRVVMWQRATNEDSACKVLTHAQNQLIWTWHGFSERQIFKQGSEVNLPRAMLVKTWGKKLNWMG